MTVSRVDPLTDLADVLRRVEKPARYVGGEFGSLVKGPSGILSIAVSYPDLYEIGMSNSAVRLLYDLLNGIDGVSCERVFAPAPDFESELRARGIPLYALETGKVLRCFDLLGFSIGYELTLTNLLAILDLGGVTLLAANREASEPIVIAGGPAVTNPVPYGPFVDCVFIGEAEGWVEETFARLAVMKKHGAARTDLLGYLTSLPTVWHAGKREVTRRAVWRGFGSRPARTGFPVPSVRTIQDHGTVEIMRGCPNACRFCHATCFYRPARLKGGEVIADETRRLVREAGYREITLSSLSSGEFPGIHGLVEGLNSIYKHERVSFSLPSLHIDSLALALLKQISEVRKSGLTFAVETPRAEWQRAIGKSVPLDKTISILREARTLGWKSAKFYFMVGLPASFHEDEASPIMEFLREIQSATGMLIHANVASFIPKSHTPFQRSPQLSEAAALDRIMTVKKGLRGDRYKIGYHAPFLSLLEGIVSRGDERAGLLVWEAFKRGARLDAWEDRIRTDIWREIISGASWDVAGETCRERREEEILPWESIHMGISDALAYDGIDATAPDKQAAEGRNTPPPNAAARILFSFTKTGRAAFISHLDIMAVFERALVRARYRAVFTEGFNPKPRLEFASPLGLGIESEEEIASVEILDFDSGESFCGRLTRALPDGIGVTRAEMMSKTRTGKKPSLMSAYWGSEYEVRSVADEGALPEIPEELVFSRAPREVLVRLPVGASSKAALAAIRAAPGLRIRRIRTFADGPGKSPLSYFELFRSSALI